MDKQNLEEWVPEHVLKLMTLKLMMESLIEVLSKLLDRMGDDPTYSSIIAQQELAKKEVEERFSTFNTLALSKCGCMSHVREQQETLNLTTSPINTPKRSDKEPFQVWKDEPESTSDDPEKVYFRVAEESPSNEDVCGLPNEPDIGAENTEDCAKDETESDEFCDERKDGEDNEGACSAEKNVILKEDLSNLEEVDAMIEAALKDPNRSVYDESLSYFISESCNETTDEKPSGSGENSSDAATETDDEADHECDDRCTQ